jgi:hypothetical protein
MLHTSILLVPSSQRHNYYWLLFGSFGSKVYDRLAASDFDLHKMVAGCGKVLLERVARSSEE